MKILFLHITSDLEGPGTRKPAHPRHKLPPLDLGYCMSIARDLGHEPLLIDTGVEDASTGMITQLVSDQGVALVIIKPDVLGTGRARALAEEIKRSSRAVIIALGPVVTAYPGSYVNEMSAVDAAIVGEPETTFSAAAGRIERGENLAGIPGLYVRSHGTPAAMEPVICAGGLDELPFPAHEEFLKRPYTFLYPLKRREKRRFAVMMTSRDARTPARIARRSSGCPRARATGRVRSATSSRRSSS